MGANGKTRKDWRERRDIRYIAGLCFTDETILTMAKFCSKWVQSVPNFSRSKDQRIHCSFYFFLFTLPVLLAASPVVRYLMKLHEGGGGGGRDCLQCSFKGQGTHSTCASRYGSFMGS